MLRAIVSLSAVVVASLALTVAYGAETRLPNVVIIFADDQGYGDVGCYGAEGYDTPHLDGMADEGMRFTSFCVAQAVCGASRAALLTGCYPNRIGMLGAPSHQAKHGINPSEMLLSELCQQRDYATAIFGKWHLGHHRQSLPLQHGFDEYFGLPYSNDMWPFHPENRARFPDLPLIDGNDAAIAAVTADHQKQLTTWYTEHAVDFIDRHHDRPFFLYVPHAMAHVPLFVSEKFAGKSEQGLYGDVMMELDWSVGQILGAIARHGLDDNTLVIYTSDNGPWLSYGNHAGSAGPLREGKGTMWEGGVREPCLMRWPGRIPAGSVCHEFAATIDIFPTVAKLIGAKLPDHPIDGLDIWPLMAGSPDAKSPHEAYFYYWGNELQAVRSGDWKLHFPHEYRTLDGPAGRDGTPSKYKQVHTDLALYNLRTDVGETRDLKQDYPEIVARLRVMADRARSELGDSATGQQGNGFRPPAQVSGE
ncbi:MAG: sulfatase [Planctomycetaceae bacterium]